MLTKLKKATILYFNNSTHTEFYKSTQDQVLPQTCIELWREIYLKIASNVKNNVTVMVKRELLNEID